ncbi:long chain fatty acid elongase [Tieghemostelium lacteum]|uniref:Elongation of fatty acids protein n=1 Tax=Tieghemostelium lacteum TaxID=361077 RepID=A0A151ZHR7_TIELA|nr:long chain fatty acid elongase [Tieghemostelium lacteum]|eukprot:KYQ93516.1 long chain fatty acid elongase [Tieghemostelium lacteum]
MTSTITSSSSSLSNSTHFDSILNLNMEQIYKDIDRFRWRSGETLFSTVHVPVLASVAYFTVIFTLQALMKNRKEIKLHSFTVFHNLFLSSLSLVMFIGVFIPQVKYLFNTSFYNLCCVPLEDGFVSFSLYVFYLSKVYEFIDTVLLVLRKKKLIFLHVYHHFITFWLVWVNLNAKTGVQWADISANCFVHIIMYYYYYQTEMGNNPWWKKYITTVQIIQFVFDMTFHVFWHYYNLNGGCSGNIPSTLFSDFVILSFLGLFIDFYLKSYSRKSSSAPTNKPKTN